MTIVVVGFIVLLVITLVAFVFLDPSAPKVDSMIDTHPLEECFNYIREETLEEDIDPNDFVEVGNSVYRALSEWIQFKYDQQEEWYTEEGN